MSPQAISVVVPVRDDAAALERCLAGLAAGTRHPHEVVVVDDGSRDDSPTRAAAAGARVLSSGGRGPAAARNVGGRAASGDWLLFLDADCVVHPDTLDRLYDALAASPWASALFGAYDDRPAAPGWVSQYRNLLHCHTHRTGRPEVSTFWSGCGAVRRAAFLEVGGFDEVRFPRLGMEDIDLGYRLREAGHRIRLDPGVEVTHLKRWTLASMLRVDLFQRGIPWTQLWLERGRVPADLAIGWRQRAGTTAAVALVVAPLVAMLSMPAAIGLVVAAAAAFGISHHRFFRFLARCRGVTFALAAVPLHLLHGLCAATGFGLGIGRHLRAPNRRPPIVRVLPETVRESAGSGASRLQR